MWFEQSVSRLEFFYILFSSINHRFDIVRYCDVLFISQPSMILGLVKLNYVKCWFFQSIVIRHTELKYLASTAAVCSSLFPAYKLEWMWISCNKTNVYYYITAVAASIGANVKPKNKVQTNNQKKMEWNKMRKQKKANMKILLVFVSKVWTLKSFAFAHTHTLLSNTQERRRWCVMMTMIESEGEKINKIVQNHKSGQKSEAEVRLVWLPVNRKWK